MIPWCNRIDNGIEVDDEKCPLAANVHGQDCPIHGSAFQSLWDVDDHQTDRVRLRLTGAGPAPFRYDAEMAFALDGANLTVDLTVRNRADRTLPYGIGLHPWLPRDPDACLTARADRVQITDARQLPVRTAQLGEHPNWDFTKPAALPDDLIDNSFGGWDGRARLDWPAKGVSLEIGTEPRLGWFQIYSPGPSTGFVCVEPCSHPVDAHNEPGHPDLWQLAPGQSTSQRFWFRPERTK